MFRRRHNHHVIQEHDIAYQEEKINELKAAIGPLSGRSQKFCTNPCLRRYLKDRNWNVVKSKTMLEETLRWRSSYKPEEICWAAKVFLDPSTVQKTKFVYPNDGQSMEVMKKHFDLDMLPMELGGTVDIKYDHREYSKAMRSDDIKMASFWGSTVEKPSCESVERSSAAATSPGSSSSSLEESTRAS